MSSLRGLWRVASLCVVLAPLVACAPPQSDLVVLRLDDPPKIGQANVHQPDGSFQLTRLNEGVMTPRAKTGKSGGNAVMLDDQQVIDSFAGAMAAQPEASTTFVVYFPLGSAELLPSSAPTLAAATLVAQHQFYTDIGLIGRADKTGDPALNRVLSAKRAQSVRNALIAAGLKPSGIDTTFVGDDFPLAPTAPGEAEQANRSVEITIR